jgi:hypothetical protein
MITKCGRIGIFTTGVVALCAQAWAGLPDVMNRVAPDTAITVVIPSLDQLDEGVASVIGALEMPMLSTPKQMLAAAGFRNGLDATRPIVIMFQSENFEEEAEPDVLMLIPTTDFDALVGQFNAVEENGLQAFQTGMGDMTFARNLGDGYALAGENAELVAAYNAEGGAAAFEKIIGRAGMDVADRSDAYAIVQFDAFRDMIKEGIDSAREEMAENMGMVAGMGGQDPEAIAAQMDQGLAMVESFVDQSQALVLGADASAMGVGIEASSNFREGSEWAGLMQVGGKSESLLAALPAGQYLMAYAADFDNPLMQQMFGKFGAMKMNLMGGMAAMEGLDAEAMLKNMKGQAMAVYPGPAGIMGGVFSGMVGFTKTDDSAAMRNAFMKAMNAMDEVEAGQGEFAMSMQSTFMENAGQINGTSYDSWGMTFNMGGQANPFMGQFMMMLFGQPDGIKGLMAATDKGVYTTYSPNPARLQDALDGGASLADDQLTKQVAEHLPSNRIGEFYLGADSILAQVMPFIQMQLGPMDLGVEGPIPPMGVGLTAGEGSLHGAMYFPMPLIQVGANLGMTFQQMQMMQDAGDDENPPF